MRRTRKSGYTPHQAFNIVYHGEKNFLTPNIVRTFRKKNYLIELSSGRGFDDNTIYGVTVLKINEKGLPEKTELNKGGISYDEAQKYIRGL